MPRPPIGTDYERRMKASIVTVIGMQRQANLFKPAFRCCGTPFVADVFDEIGNWKSNADESDQCDDRKNQRNVPTSRFI